MAKASSNKKDEAGGGVSISIGGDVEGSQVIGAGRDVHIAPEKLDSDEIARAFAAIYEQIEARPPDPKVDRAEIKETVEKIKAEVRKEDEANPDKVERWFRFLAEMAPDVLELVAATLASPIAGVGTVIRNVAERAKGGTTD